VLNCIVGLLKESFFKGPDGSLYLGILTTMRTDNEHPGTSHFCLDLFKESSQLVHVCLLGRPSNRETFFFIGLSDLVQSQHRVPLNPVDLSVPYENEPLHLLI